MKEILKGKLLKKLKTIKTIGYLKPERILQVNALDGYLSNSIARAPFTNIQENPNKDELKENIFPVQEPEIISVSELMKDLDDQEMDSDSESNNKENVIPDVNPKNDYESKGKDTEKMSTWKRESVPLCEIDASCFRRPDLDSGTLFDPNLLAAFKQAVMEVKAFEAERRRREEEEYINLDEHNEEQPPLKARKIEEIKDPLLDFEQKCPPGGSDSVILYTTGIRGIRKTFEDCHKMRSLLENLRILFLERDISMHSEFKEELWGLLDGKIVPPRLFIKGRYIGGVDEVLGLHERGKLKPLFEGIPIDRNEGPCEGCVGIKFIVCFNCNGSRKIVPEGGGGGGGGEGMNCLECNENGIVICPFCC